MQLYKLYVKCGRLAYKMCRPVLRIFIKRTTRAYVIVRHQDEVLLLRNWLGKQDWQLPGGGVGRDESPASAAARELFEELNVTVDAAKLKHFAQGKWTFENLNYRYIIFTTEISKKPIIKRKAWEVIDARWIPITQLNLSNTHPTVLSIIKKVATY